MEFLINFQAPTPEEVTSCSALRSLSRLFENANRGTKINGRLPIALCVKITDTFVPCTRFAVPTCMGKAACYKWPGWRAVGVGASFLSFSCVISCGGDNHATAPGRLPVQPPLAHPTSPAPSDPEPSVSEPVTIPHPDLGLLRRGTYGGRNVLVSIGKKDIKFTVPCAVGHVAGPIQTLDGKVFDVSGTYQAVSGRYLVGPVFPARFFGTVEAGVLHFDIAYSDQHGIFFDQVYDAFFRRKANFDHACLRDLEELELEDPGSEPDSALQ
jgi:hypothetical protein